MILSIALKEWKEFWRDRGMRLILFAFLGVYALSLATSVLAHYRYERDRQAAQAGVREAWLNQGDKNPHAATYFGMIAFPRRSALSILEPGALPYLGVAAYLHPSERVDFVDLPARDENPLAGIARLSPAFCWQVLFPLLIVFLTYSVLARDRETGMERYLMAVGSNRATLVFGKASGIGLVVLSVYLSGFALGGLVASIVGGFGEEDMSAWLLLAMFYLLYGGTIFLLTIAISGAVRTRRAALMGGLVMWLLVCVILPPLAADYGRTSRASPSSMELSRIAELDSEKGFADQPPREARMEMLMNTLFRELKVGRREDLPVNLPGFVFISESEMQSTSERQRREQARATLAEQTLSYEWAATMSPASALTLLTTSLAGTSAEQRHPAVDAADIYASGFRRILNRELAAKGRQEGGGMMMRGRSLWSQIDSFEPDLPAQIARLSERGRSISTLLIWFTLSLLAAATSALVVPQLGDRS